MNIYQFLDITWRYTPTTGYAPELLTEFGLVMRSVPFCCFFSRNAVWQVYDNTLNITVMLVSSSQAGWENSFSVSYG